MIELNGETLDLVMIELKDRLGVFSPTLDQIFDERTKDEIMEFVHENSLFRTYKSYSKNRMRAHVINCFTGLCPKTIEDPRQYEIKEVFSLDLKCYDSDIYKRLEFIRSKGLDYKVAASDIGHDGMVRYTVFIVELIQN